MLIVKPALSRKEINDFVMLPFQLYKGQEAWVPPLISDFRKYIMGKNNALHQAGENERVIAYLDGKPAGRLLVGINDELNEYKGFRDGYIALYECMEQDEVSRKLLSYAEDFLRKRGVNKIKGPLSLPGGDDYRGFIIDNFEDPTLIMNTYNKEYYNKQFLDYGFRKYYDCYAYKAFFSDEHKERLDKLIPYVKKRYKYTVEPLDLKQIDREIADVKEVINKAMPEEWDDFMPPTDEEIQIIKDQLIPFADPDFVYIARDENRKPIGFDIALPDYNQVLKKLGGRLFPFGIFKFLYYKRKIDRLRIFTLFVVPEYRKKGVTAAIYYEGLKRGLERGYKFVEGSTIWEYNKPMLNDVLGFSDEPYKTYRIYYKDLL
ncbi:GNAT family N-acetyltransferase [Proteiniclasticum sp. C24MP]|uniref:GNAT family N-acetyltransferase n=1 Tax=Proteiniclasticum sp. C24MP TaxID=3374101 RepID=UPI0037553ED7